MEKDEHGNDTNNEAVDEEDNDHDVTRGATVALKRTQSCKRPERGIVKKSRTPSDGMKRRWNPCDKYRVQKRNFNTAREDDVYASHNTQQHIKCCCQRNYCPSL
jgi:hypothetical protein